MTFDELAKAASASPANALKYCSVLEEAMIRFGIRTKNQRAMFVAQCAVESINLSKVEESLYYKDAQRVANMYYRVFKGNAAKAEPYTRNHSAMSQLLYQGYHGRGLIQLTWVDNYINAGKYLGFDYVNNPDLLLQPWHAAMSAGWYFAVKTNCLTPADAGNTDAVTRLINPAMMHAAERRTQFKIALTADL